MLLHIKMFGIPVDLYGIQTYEATPIALFMPLIGLVGIGGPYETHVMAPF